MAYFVRSYHTLVEDATPSTISHTPALQDMQNHFINLHKLVYSQVRTLNMDLHVYRTPANAIVNLESVATMRPGGVMSISYTRSGSQAAVVERLMGREEVASAADFEPRRHPVIEMRISPEHFVVELVLSPDAWWDQQNLVGKLSIARHRQDFYKLLRTLPEEYCLGFWRGIHLSDMHLGAIQFHRTQVLNEWLSTFEPGKDWFRVGLWYTPETASLGSESIATELVQQCKLLYSIYENLLWTSSNNFRNFYNGPMTL